VYFKWKKGLTPEEAALFAVGLNDYTQIEDAKSDLCEFAITRHDDEPNFGPHVEYLDEIYDNYGEQIYREEELTYENVMVASAIKDALEDDALIACGNTDRHTELEIFSECWVGRSDDPDTFLNHKETKFTKSSLAIWFLNQNEPEMAKKFDPNVTPVEPFVPAFSPSPNIPEIQGRRSNKEFYNDLEGQLSINFGIEDDTISKLEEKIGELRAELEGWKELATTNFQSAVFNTKGNTEGIGTRLGRIAADVYAEYYAHLNEGDDQPSEKKVKLELEEKYPDLTVTEIGAIYRISRKTLGSSKVKLEEEG